MKPPIVDRRSRLCAGLLDPRGLRARLPRRYAVATSPTSRRTARRVTRRRRRISSSGAPAARVSAELAANKHIAKIQNAGDGSPYNGLSAAQRQALIAGHPEDRRRDEGHARGAGEREAGRA